MIPKPVLSQAGIRDRVELTVERGAVVLRAAKLSVRHGWTRAAEAVASRTQNEFVVGEFANAADGELTW